VFVDHCFQIAVRRRDQAGIEAKRTGAPQALEFALLQHTQELRLELQGDFPDLVEEDRPAMCQLEAACPSSNAPVKAPYSCPKSSLSSKPVGMAASAARSVPDACICIRFDVNARAEDPAKTTQKQLLTMLPNLLVERFLLKFQYRSSEAPEFSLTVTKGGPKLGESTSKEAKTLFTRPQGETLLRPTGRATSLTAREDSMAMLVNLLSAIGQSGPGVDRTGLSGEYDFTLSSVSEAGPALSTALRELGLQMKTEKVPVSTFVLDAAEKPNAN